MLFELREGGRAELVIKAALAAGREPPPAISTDRVYCWDVSMPYWQAFWALSGSREMALGFGFAAQQAIPYPWLSMYADDHGLKDDADEYAIFVTLVQFLDIEYRREMARIAEATRPKGRT